MAVNRSVVFIVGDDTEFKNESSVMLKKGFLLASLEGSVSFPLYLATMAEEGGFKSVREHLYAECSPPDANGDRVSAPYKGTYNLSKKTVLLEGPQGALVDTVIIVDELNSVIRYSRYSNPVSGLYNVSCIQPVFFSLPNDERCLL